MSRYSLFVDKWKDCTACELQHGRINVVQARGSIPCDILFVGEAPGESENVVGKPFKGPSGRVLESIIRKAVPETLKWAMTNMVCCIPRDEDGDKVSEPPDEAIEACSTRLVEFIKIANPRLLVGVGRLAGDWLTPGYSYSIKTHKRLPLVVITHPAAILRANIANQGLAVQRCIVTISNAIEEYLSDRSDKPMGTC